jgi:ATP-dependent exoDNAse (exonuclease V) alpha subunit
MHFKQGYVETSHSSQGKDCQDVYISMTDRSFAASNAQQFYVSVSRGIHSAKIYTNEKEELKRVINRSVERITAKEIAYGHQARLMREKQKANYQDLNRRQQDHGRE